MGSCVPPNSGIFTRVYIFIINIYYTCIAYEWNEIICFLLFCGGM